MHERVIVVILSVYLSVGLSRSDFIGVQKCRKVRPIPRSHRIVGWMDNGTNTCTYKRVRWTSRGMSHDSMRSRDGWTMGQTHAPTRGSGGHPRGMSHDPMRSWDWMDSGTNTCTYKRVRWTSYGMSYGPKHE